MPNNDATHLIHSTLRMTGLAGVFNIVLTVVCIWLAWRALQALKLEAFLKHPRSGLARGLLLLASVVLGHSLARFILDYLAWSAQIRLLF